jgi:hypothetical protein
MYLLRCATGHGIAFRHDVPDAAARELAALAADEPTLAGPDDPSRYLDDYLALLAPVTVVDHGLTWRLPPDVCTAASRTPPDALETASHTACAAGEPTIIASGTPAGDALIVELDRQMPPALVAVGFVNTGELWPPWCMAVVDGEIASIAFAARLGADAAAAGVFTLAPYRGRGLAARVTAAWAAHSALADRELFYGTSTTNRSSQRVVARLGLPFFGRALLVT